VFSRDPNEKVGSQGALEPQYVSGKEPFRYTIYFENEATATAPAQEVVITDQLDGTKVDLTTFSLGPISFGDKQIVPPPGVRQFSTDVDLRPEKNLIVRINAGVDATGRASWYFGSIDPDTGELTEDPLGGFLPPNVNPPEGDGSVVFTVMPKTGLATGTEIRNKATIVFDLNAPIDTPEWFNTLDNTKPESQVLPLAATQLSNYFTVEWAGTDEHSGILDYSVFVSEDGGPFTPWLTNTTETSATFTGQAGKSYVFYSLARDAAGNIEDAPTVPDATTQVAAAMFDLAVTDITAPASVTLRNNQAVTRGVQVQIQNRSTQGVTIPDAATLAALVTLSFDNLGGGGCPSPSASVRAAFLRRLPLTVRPKQKVTVPFDVAFGCANDPVNSTRQNPGHEDFSVSARVNTGALGSPDLHTDDDVCPRSVSPPGVIDPHPDGTILDKGCGKLKPDGTRGALILIDIVVP
jgi:hypothetical protein